jgi:hypothetical protein
MLWRVLAVAVVLLGVGAVGGYAVAERGDEGPSVGGTPSPVAAQRPAAPTPPVIEVLDDPTAPALEPGIALEAGSLRTKKYGLDLDVPVGWTQNRLPDKNNTWTFVPQPNTSNTYYLRVGIVIGDQESVTVKKESRISALKDAVRNEGFEDLQLLAQTPDTIEYSYVLNNYRRFTHERWVSFGGDASNTAYAVAAVTGREADREGLRDLLTRVTDSMAEGEPVPPKSDTGNDSSGS